MSDIPGDDLDHVPFVALVAVAVFVLIVNLAKAGLLG